MNDFKSFSKSFLHCSGFSVRDLSETHKNHVYSCTNIDILKMLDKRNAAV